jgi:hypothetical protein
MKQWNKINWPALNSRAYEIEAELWPCFLAQHNLKEKSVAASPITQADQVTAKALMVWCDDGGSAA